MSESNLKKRRTEIGVILPHFSNAASWERLIGFADTIERLGFDSIWVRDNLNYRGHPYELPGRRFVEPFITLSAIAALTRKVHLGTAVLVPYRHPLVTAQMVGSLAWVSRGRLQLGIGPGGPRDPFDLTGIPYENRITLCKETAEVIRAASSGNPFSYDGDLTSFQNVVIDPAPPESTMIWYGGGSRASVRRAADYCDGLLPGRCPFNHLDWVRRLVAEQHGKTNRDIRIGSIPLVIIDESGAKARARLEERLPALLAYLSKQWKKDYESIDEIAGSIVYGDPFMVAEQLNDFLERQCDLVVLDARLQMDEFEQALCLIGEEVLPLLKDHSWFNGLR